ncbi:MAG: tetratricopeptide repeat protein, partial [Bacteroidota bacterium]
NASIHNNIGFAKFRVEKYEAAIPDFELAIKLSPDDAYPYNNLGFAYYKLGKLDLALEKINHSIFLDKGNSFAYKNRALVQIANSQMELACADLDKAEKYGFAAMYGNEVEELRKQYCLP